jgi:hypothetical protein
MRKKNSIYMVAMVVASCVMLHATVLNDMNVVVDADADSPRPTSAVILNVTNAV